MSFLAVVLSPFILAMLVPLLRKAAGNKIGWVVSLLPLTLFIWLVKQLPTVMSGEPVTVFYNWVPSIGVNFSLYLDGLSLLFGFLITGIGFAVIVYSIYYLSTKENLTNFYVFILLFMGAMLGVVMSNNLILMYIFWELTSFSSFLLIGFWYHKERSRYGAQKSMLITVIGGFSMLAGIVMLWVLTGTFEVREIIAQAALIKESGFYIPITILVLLGAFSKSAQIPFHIWLPDAMEAPTPISCYLHSATMVKAGIYLIARMTGALGGTEFWFLTVSSIGLGSLMLGSYLALKQKDLKAILAFSTISQLGLIITLIGYGTPGAIMGGIFHLFNHSAFKGSLFLMVGIVDHETGTRDISKLRGLAKVMPYTAAIAVIGSLAMAGVPPFNGFLSKELFFTASVEAVTANLAFIHPYAWLFPLIALCASIFTFVYSVSIFHKVFFSGEVTKETPKHPHEAPVGLLLPGLLLVSINVIIGLFPGLVAKSIIEPAVVAITGAPFYVKIYHWHGLNLPLAMSLVVIIVGLVLYYRLDQLKAALARVPGTPSSNRFYDWAVPAVLNGALRITNIQMTGFLRDYNLFIILYTLLVVGGTIFMKDALIISTADLAEVAFFEVVMALILVAGALGVVFLKSRLAAIVSLGVVGYTVALLFVIFRAPDLALTQLLVETVTLALFLLAFSRLPKFLSEHDTPARVKGINVVAALLTGALATTLTLIGHSNKYFEPISHYFIENTKKLGGGTNAVNVILVDFRGLDTLGEIAVLGIAGLGVYAMIKLAIRKGGKAHENE
ncbi:hydrogen gas-evolving membrane-bound hydrogenase subunit E [Desulfitibacter alkalitolerans]|uniref:hydrogen gas-evolving membrane-bound hydrogenase subunit E n=1 Tax=Desulfitibacter alkalitolerans TaxID=264641 RepID=UPI0004889EA1|nr:hydrogen gas-evolving membrane-bound hydrogenase subunit E [Desulfitibacter alkalitolerans]